MAPHEGVVILIAIARRLNRSLNTVPRYLKNLQKYNAEKKSGRRPKLSAHDKRSIEWEITRGGSSF